MVMVRLDRMVPMSSGSIELISLRFWSLVSREMTTGRPLPRVNMLLTCPLPPPPLPDGAEEASADFEGRMRFDEVVEEEKDSDARADMVILLGLDVM